LDITQDLTITGAGPSNTIIDANHLDRVFHAIGSVAFHLSGVDIKNGEVFDSGGGIENPGGQLFLDQVTVENNQSGSAGAGLHNAGTTTITNSTIRNTAPCAEGDRFVKLRA